MEKLLIVTALLAPKHEAAKRLHTAATGQITCSGYLPPDTRTFAPVT
jgi:hypothetical protein